jgi:hypothetical protein
MAETMIMAGESGVDFQCALRGYQRFQERGAVVLSAG